jgi:hypothetical protein
MALTLARVLFAVAILRMTLPAGAQEQIGSIEGVVRDLQGGVVPGSTVEARNLAVGSAVTATTDAVGVFRFAALPPGYYDVSTAVSGFRTLKFASVEVLLGQIKRLEFTLEIAGISEQTVVVAASSPLIDVKQSARGFSVRQDQIQVLPRSTDYTSIAAVVPGANPEPKLGGLSVDGSSAAENRFIIDGIDTSHLKYGTPDQPLNIDTVDELQIKSSGYAAEYGGATGGVINVLTKSGTNDWHGDARFYYAGSGLDAGPRPTLRRKPTDTSQAEYVTYPEDAYRSPMPGFSLGGPIARDKAWFYVAYQPQLKFTERTVTFALDGSTNTFHQDYLRHFLSASQSLQLGSKLHTRVAFNLGSARTDGVLPPLAGSSAPNGHYDYMLNEPRWTGSASADYMVSSKVFLTGRVGYYYGNTYTENVWGATRYVFGRSNIGLLDVPPELQRVTGFATDAPTLEYVRDRNHRLSMQVDGTWYVNFWGSHAFKAGVQADWSGNDLFQGQKANNVNLQWNRSLAGKRGKYGYYQFTSNSLEPRRGSIWAGIASGNTGGLFVQDNWTVGRRLSLSLGLRTERENLPGYSLHGDAAPVIKFGFGDKIAPRVGASFDLFGDGSWKVYGSWGVFYDIFKYSLSIAFGGIDSIGYAFTLDTYDWPNLLSSTACPPTCPGTLIRRSVTLPTDKAALDPELRPIQLQEAVAGVEHQLRPNVSVAARYVHKQLDRAIEDIGSVNDNGVDYEEVYTIGNPGFGRATLAYPGVALPKAKRNYDALELSVRRLMSQRWALFASYTYSRLWGNYSGLSQSDEEGRVSPYVGRIYDYPLMMFDEKAKPVYGRLATDRPHQGKITASYMAPFGITATLFQYVGSGLPVSREVPVFPGSYFPVMYHGRLSDGRTPVLTQSDIYVQKEFRLKERYRLAIALNASNLFNQSTVISKYVNQTDDALAINEADFYAGKLDFEKLIVEQKLLLDPGFMKDRYFQAPLSIRLMVKFTF